MHVAAYSTFDPHVWVFVTGTSPATSQGNNIVTLAYDDLGSAPAGSPTAWSFNRTGVSLADEAVSIDVQEEVESGERWGAAYVVGASRNGDNWDYVTLKAKSTQTGSLVWSIFYPTSTSIESADDWGVAVDAVDYLTGTSATGNGAFVTGIATDTSVYDASLDWLTVLYREIDP